MGVSSNDTTEGIINSLVPSSSSSPSSSHSLTQSPSTSSLHYKVKYESLVDQHEILKQQLAEERLKVALSEEKNRGILLISFCPPFLYFIIKRNTENKNILNDKREDKNDKERNNKRTIIIKTNTGYNQELTNLLTMAKTKLLKTEEERKEYAAYAHERMAMREELDSMRVRMRDNATTCESMRAEASSARAQLAEHNRRAEEKERSMNRLRAALTNFEVNINCYYIPLHYLFTYYVNSFILCVCCYYETYGWYSIDLPKRICWILTMIFHKREGNWQQNERSIRMRN